ncbi:MAG: TIGR01777 family protein [Pirellulaceae bacterium]|nr:TIGR01777 family protein [Pirellulaceae bacterium]
MSEDKIYVASTTLPVSVADAFAYHDRRGALERLIPPWESAHIESSDQSLEVGSRVVLKTKIAGVPLRWVAEHTHYDPPTLFADTQISGPFAKWNHRHHFIQAGDESSLIKDEIQYRLPGGSLGRLFGGSMAQRTIESMFSYRHQVTRDDLQLFNQYPTSPLTVAISGASGLVGAQLSALLSLLGHRTLRIVRNPTNDSSDIAVWSDPADVAKLEDVDAVIHLAGKPIADDRWTDDVKQQIRDSRVIKTRELCESLAKLHRKPKVLICASATGIYGNRGDEILDENSAAGGDFLADVAREWEDACQGARDAGIRVVNTRFGIVLTPRGGALQKMLLPAKLAGGSLGNGQQWWSWIALDDVLGAIYHCIQDDSISGAVNFVAPEPIRNRDFAKTLGRVLGRPALLPAPAFGLRLALGEMADALLLASTRAVPQKLLQSTYKYRFDDLESALRYYLGRNRLESSQ